jgi:hypothetical protein
MSAGALILALLVVIGTSLRLSYLLYHRAQFETEIAVYASSMRIGGTDAAFDWALRLGPLPRAFHMLIVRISLGSTLAAALLEVVIATIICLPIFVLSKQLYPSVPGAGLAGAALFAFHPQAIIYCCFFLDHQPVTALALIAFVLLGQRWTEGASYWRSLLCGVTLGLLGLSRAVMLAAIVPLVSRISLAAARHRAALVHALLLVSAAAGVLAPWIYHQTHSSGVFVPVSSGGGVTLLWGTLLDYSKPRYQLQADILGIVEEMRAREGIEMIAAGPADDARAARAAVDKISMQPGQWLLGVFYKAGAFWYSDHTPLRTWLDLSVNVPLLILGAAGAVSAIAKGRAVVFVASVLLSIDMAYALLHSMAQYSTPVLPLLSALASGPMASLVSRIRHGR